MKPDLEKYLIEWHQNIVNSNEPAPKNEPEFIDMFIDYLNGIDPEDVQFNGVGSYFGKEVVILEDKNYFPKYGGFEIAYEKDKLISVYTNRHDGFWTPEYIKMYNTHERFSEIQSALFSLLTKTFGL